MALKHTEVETYFGKCRCCLNCGYLKNMWTEHYNGSEKEIYGLMLTQCFSLSWEQPYSEEFVEQICELCVRRLRDACSFKEMMLKAQDELFADADNDHEIKVEDLSGEDGDENRLDLQYEEDIKNILVNENEVHDVDNTENVESAQIKDEVVYEEVEYLEDECGEEIKESLVENNEDSVQDNEPKQGSRKRKWPKKLPREQRLRTYRQYTEEELRQCVNTVFSKKMSSAEAAKVFNIPRKTINAKVRMLNIDPEAENTEFKQKQYNFIKEIKTVLTYTNATPYKSKTVKFYCAYCFTDGPIFEDAEELRIHTRIEHVADRIRKIDLMIRPHWMNEILKLDIDKLSCTVCTIGIANWNELFKHLKERHDVELEQAYTRIIPYTLDADNSCALCRMSFTNYMLLDSHMNRHYNNYMCQDCGDTFVAEIRLRQHVKIHEVGNFPCYECGKVFSLQKYRRKHEEMVHRQRMRFKCYYCPEKFSADYTRHAHVVEKHFEKIKIITCEFCGKTFDWRQNYLAHLRKTHNKDKKFQCKVCDKRFLMKYGLKEHELRHSGEKNFACGVCNKKYYTKTSVRMHMKQHRVNE